MISTGHLPIPIESGEIKGQIREVRVISENWALAHGGWEIKGQITAAAHHGRRRGAAGSRAHRMYKFSHGAPRARPANGPPTPQMVQCKQYRRFKLMCTENTIS
jgi:hypothetical protein